MDLQIAQSGGSPEKTLWQICQLVVGDLPGKKEVRCIIQFTKSKIRESVDSVCRDGTDMPYVAIQTKA